MALQQRGRAYVFIALAERSRSVGQNWGRRIHIKAFGASTTSMPHSILRTCISLEFFCIIGISHPKMVVCT
ncbi:hypothetical protein DB811_23695 [Xanthomonas perforans]|uniref:Uncharacterized protein n=1 Tax=Xanthomonas perforans TaxID=442694 RepID=A0AAQ0YQY1_XANPE|nr:hypothetical protein DB854_13750 [Xanthomonas perforans]RXD38129.1 hypothetical protein DB757_18075 [Xanthomonas perforans]RXD54900.1 hypothetical protein DB755_17965 [Xanthomonas perforans]RXD55032.1 hypothetical protein DB769_07725 [Xanthomonas perforans]RXD74413.1 hypothetical protein DB799_23605 [Xanthomonas perforans]